MASIKLSEKNVKATRIIMTPGFLVSTLLFLAMVAKSVQPIISCNYGAKQDSRVRQALSVAILTALICGVTVSF